MALIVQGPVPPRWSRRDASIRGCFGEACPRHEETISLALVNNMPDAALEDTELQFFDLLDSASGEIPVVLKLYSTNGVPRSENGQRRLDSFYFATEDLWRCHFDGVIITGTEPQKSDLREERYWSCLTEILDWASRNTCSTVLSCLAAHASVLHFDGVGRRRLDDKRFGVFASSASGDHPLLARVSDPVLFPHSRWNEVRSEDLTSAGYTVLTQSEQAGVDIFLKKINHSTLLHFQGHPEYGLETLSKEYRRDIKRFLRGERDTYPSVPVGYFGAAALALLNEFRESALRSRSEEMLEEFPASISADLKNGWRHSAEQIYRNWLVYLKASVSERARPLARQTARYAAGAPPR